MFEIDKPINGVQMYFYIFNILWLKYLKVESPQLHFKAHHSLSLPFEELQNNLNNHVMCVSLVTKLGPK